MENKLIIIAGPTACGKTSAAIQLAHKIGGEIISADSMQVYKYMDIGTAKPTLAEMEHIPHYLVDELDPADEFNVTVFQEKAKKYMKEIWAKNKYPIIVGGTGFYINALVYDNNFTSTNSDTSFRENLYLLAKEQGPDIIYEKLKEIDPDYAQTVHANNVKRVVRALEYHHLTGELFSKHNASQKEKKSPYDTTFIILNMEREKLYQRIEQRIELMLQAGLIKEVEYLLNKGYTPDLVSMQGIGYKEIIPYVKGDISYDLAISQLKKNTRHFAKRQITWFKRQTDGFWLDTTFLTEEERLQKMLELINFKQ